MRSNKTDQFQKVAQEIYKKNLELYNERKRAELLLYKVSEAIYATDPKGKITLFNHTLEKMLNTTSAEVIGKKASDIISITTEKGEAIDITSFYRMTENFGIPDTAILLSPEGKKYYVHIKVSVIKTGENNIEHLVTMSDITKEKEFKFTSSLVDSLRKMPNYIGTVYRGMKNFRFSSHHKAGDSFYWRSFTSTSQL